MAGVADDDIFALRVQNLIDEKDLSNFNPIEGLVDVPALPLLEALQPLFNDPEKAHLGGMLKVRAKNALEAVEDVRLEMQQAKQAGKTVREEDWDSVSALSLDEMAAIHLYTQESPFYPELNKLLVRC